MTDKKYSRAVIAFSGGLDTSMLVPYIRETYDLEHITTCIVDTGNMTENDISTIAARAEEVGSNEHVYIDASTDFYDEVIKYLIFGNVSRDGYPLCVGAERLIQAREVIRLAKERNIDLVANGSTGAGNDQYRFDLVAFVKGDGVTSVAPVRTHNIKRSFSQNFLKERQISVPEKSAYSYNAGLWGISIGGEETHSSTGLIPEHAWYSKVDADAQLQTLILEFKQGEPVSLEIDGQLVHGPLDVIRKLGGVGSRMGIGRHYHLGTSIPGKKGRIAYESPAADILYEAHRMLEKHVMTQSQIFFKKTVADEFGKLIHEAFFFDPLIDDLRAYLSSSQKRVTGRCTVRLRPYSIESVIVETPYDLLTATGSVYGEHSDFYDARDAEGSSKLHAYEQLIYQQAGTKH